MLKLTNVLFLFSLFFSVFGERCSSPRISSKTYVTQDATILKQIAFIIEFEVQCSNLVVPGRLWALHQGKYFEPVANVGPGKYQVSWTVEVKQAKVGSHAVKIYDEHGYTQVKRALRIGEDETEIQSFTVLEIQNTGLYMGPIISCEFLASILSIFIAYYAIHFRGQESTGLVTSEGNDEFHIHKGMGLVKHVFNNDSISKLKGTLGIGHTRYSTSAKSEQINCQPFVVHSMHGSLAVAHNGELVNASSLRKQVLQRGVGLSTHSDSELITQALCLIPPDGEVNGPDWPARIRHLMQLAPLSYSLVIMLKDRIYAVRDPYGNRPLCLGKIISSGDENGSKPEGWVVSSESCAFMTVTRYVREILPGEILELTSNGVRTMDIVSIPDGKKLAFCIFEYVYFARPNSIFQGQEVYTVRNLCGAQLALEHPVEADMVGSVPESGNAAAFGYSTQSNIPFGELLTKNNYVGRTFIQPSNRLRQMNVTLKFSPILYNVRGKRIILIDDSIVRGNTVGPIIKLLRRAGAKEVHIRVASPPLRYPCYMGINIPTKEELIANTLTSKELAVKVGADSLEYLSVEGLVKAVTKNLEPEHKGHCTACLTGDYPDGIPDELTW